MRYAYTSFYRYSSGGGFGYANKVAISRKHVFMGCSVCIGTTTYQNRWHPVVPVLYFTLDFLRPFLLVIHSTKTHLARVNAKATTFVSHCRLSSTVVTTETREKERDSNYLL